MTTNTNERAPESNRRPRLVAPRHEPSLRWRMGEVDWLFGAFLAIGVRIADEERARAAMQAARLAS